MQKLTDKQMAKIYAMPMDEVLELPASTLFAFLRTGGHLAGFDQRIADRIETALSETGA